jgi:hypothetical protein
MKYSCDIQSVETPPKLRQSQGMHYSGNADYLNN